MDNPEECSVCFSRYNESDRRPRTLPCGHTFCSHCVADVMEASHVCCPTCRAAHHATDITDFPINYGIEALLKKLQDFQLTQPSAPPLPATDEMNLTLAEQEEENANEESTALSRKQQFLLQRQKHSVEGLVTGLEMLQSNLDQYHQQIGGWKAEHLQLLEELYVLVEHHNGILQLLQQEDSRVVEMKKEGEEEKQQLKTALESLESVSTTQEADTAINQAHHCTTESNNWKERCQGKFPDTHIVTTSLKVRSDTREVLDRLSVAAEDDAKPDPQVPSALHNPSFSIMDKVRSLTHQVPLTVEDFCQMSRPVRKLVMEGSVYVVQSDQGGVGRPHRSSKITVENGQVHLHTLIDQSPPSNAAILPMNEVLGLLDHSSTLAFLDLSWGWSTKKRVYIRLQPNNTLATQFVLLCTGQHQHSYLNSIMQKVGNKGQPGECVVGGDYQYNNGQGGSSLVNHSGNKHWQSGRAGTVCSWYGFHANKSAQFAIITRDINNDWPYVFGRVEKGLEVVRAAIDHSNIQQVTVVDCGVILPL